MIKKLKNYENTFHVFFMYNSFNFHHHTATPGGRPFFFTIIPPSQRKKQKLGSTATVL
jgi:hypothetical protein